MYYEFFTCNSNHNQIWYEIHIKISRHEHESSYKTVNKVGGARISRFRRINRDQNAECLYCSFLACEMLNRHKMQIKFVRNPWTVTVFQNVDFAPY